MTRAHWLLALVVAVFWVRTPLAASAGVRAAPLSTLLWSDIRCTNDNAVERALADPLSLIEAAPRVASSPLLARLPIGPSHASNAPIAVRDAPLQLSRDLRETLQSREKRRRVPRLGDDPPWC